MARYDAIVVGGAPGGSSAAISMAKRGARVLLLEAKHMPRGKLCGEFITPECFASLERLGVMERMISAGARRIVRASLVAPGGERVEVGISSISSAGSWAMSLSRSRFDQILFDRAREAGVDCREGVAVKSCLFEGGFPSGVQALSLRKGSNETFQAPVIVDASGRNSRFMFGRRERLGGRPGARLYAMKAHLAGVTGIEDQVELHFFPQGYGGLSRVEGGLVNLCFIVDEQTLRLAGGEPSRLLEISLKQNEIARARLAGSEVASKWFSAGPLTFGSRRLAREGIIAIGDAAGMIDPFTGTGIQMALRTGEMAAEAIIAADGRSGSILSNYQRNYRREFGSRLRTAGRLRGLAFSPRAAQLAAGVLARMPWLARALLRGTRSASGTEE